MFWPLFLYILFYLAMRVAFHIASARRRRALLREAKSRKIPVGTESHHRFPFWRMMLMNSMSMGGAETDWLGLFFFAVVVFGLAASWSDQGFLYQMYLLYTFQPGFIDSVSRDFPSFLGTLCMVSLFGGFGIITITEKLLSLAHRMRYGNPMHYWDLVPDLDRRLALYCEAQTYRAPRRK